MSRPKGRLNDVTRQDLRQLAALFVNNPNGLTINDIVGATGWPHGRVNRLLRKLRRQLGDSDWNVVAEAVAPRQPWVYRTVDSYDDAAWWVDNRLGDAESRFITLHDVARALVAATDGRTAEGRRARIMERHSTRMMEDLADLEGRLAV
jgi:hypothetical protein